MICCCYFLLIPHPVIPRGDGWDAEQHSRTECFQGSRDRAGGLYFIRSKWIVPSGEILEEINYRSIIIGFFMLSSGILTGAVWAHYAWGSYWSWDPKETWSLITWIVYALFLHARFVRGWKGRRMAALSVIGFACVIMTYFGVNFFLSGLHSYAT